jgi:drug/metabolite transporter (DMT)-like permease
MITLALAVEGLPVLHHSAATWAALGYLAVVATAGAYMLYYRVLAAAGAGNLSLVTLLVAPFAILLGALVLGETLPPRAYAGFAILAAGLLLIDGRVMARWHPPAP